MQKSKRRFFQNTKIRFKLVFWILIIFFLAVGSGSLFLYLSIQRELETGIEQQLQTSTQLILQLVKTTADTSIKNYLKAVAETNKAIVNNHYQRSLEGLVSEETAKADAAEELLSQHIGISGYLYAINSNAVVQFHPEQSLVGTNQSAHEHIRFQTTMKSGYTEYEWLNPGEDSPRPKALYMTYFAPWDWIITASSYRDEFGTFFSLDELRESMLSIDIGQTGYPYIINSKGLVLLHPNLEGDNVLDVLDADGKPLFQEIIKIKNGKLTYSWQNPEDAAPRRKIIFFNYLKELDWVVVSSGYVDELYAPLRGVRVSLLVTMVMILILIVPFILLFGSSLTKPLDQIIHHLSSGTADQPFEKIDVSGRDEIGLLSTYYNRFMERLKDSCRELERSEEKYRGLWENSLEGIIRSTPEGKIISCNPATALMYGYGTPEKMMDEVRNVSALYDIPEERKEFLQKINEAGFVRNVVSMMIRKGGERFWVSRNSRKVVDDDGNFIALDSFIFDITRQKEYEESRKRAQEELERRVVSRTAELSSMITELKALNTQSDLLREMGEMLQVCRAQEEMFPIIRLYLGKLFPEDAVSLYLCDKDCDMLGICLNTNDTVVWATEFAKEDCWALRKGKSHRMSFNEDSLICGHWHEADMRGDVLCVPLVGQEELVGVLQILSGFQNSRRTDVSKEVFQSRKKLAATVAEHLALALLNINLRESLRLQSIEDPLTGLYNRRYMIEFMRRETARLNRSNSITSVVMMDVDHFKQFNDNYGHETGDQILQKLSAFLKTNLRTTDLACRFGGEEFVLVLVDTPPDQCVEKAEQLRIGVEKSVIINNGETDLHVTVSMGVACTESNGELFEDVLQAADAALYTAKNNGRNRVEATFA